MRLELLSHLHRPQPGPLERLPAGPKLLVGLGIIVCTVLAPARQPGWVAALALLVASAVVASRLPIWFVLKRLLVLSPFVLGVALVQAWQAQDRAAWGMTLAKSGVCLTTVILLANTTPFTHTLQVLRRAGAPGLLMTTLALMYRYLFVLAEEAQRMDRARASRTFRASRRLQWQGLATLLGQLFARASERAERIYAAMCARGWR
jgi:cobalt/nickel transport system permease protein